MCGAGLVHHAPQTRRGWRPVPMGPVSHASAPVDCARRAAVLVDHRRHRVHVLADRAGRAVERQARDHRARRDRVPRAADRGRDRPRDLDRPALGPRTAERPDGDGPNHLRADDLLFIAVAAIPGAVAGGRLGYWLLHYDYYSSPSGRDLRHLAGRLRAVDGRRRRHPHRRVRRGPARGAGRPLAPRARRPGPARARGGQGGDGARRRRPGRAVGRQPRDRVPRARARGARSRPRCRRTRPRRTRRSRRSSCCSSCSRC